MERLAPFAAMGPDAEARHATVVKCDIVGSTQTKRLLDLEGQLAFQRGCEQVTTEIAARYNAHIERFEGDGALIVLGLPQPQEDAAESAVRMGLDLIAAMRDAKLLPGVRLQLRVGIASGLIAVIKRPSNPKGDSIAGMTIEMAERLRAIAGPEQVVVADATRRLAGAFFRYEDLGDVGCKGFETGVRAWRVAGTSHVLSRFEARRFECARGKIIGRADALCRLAEAWTASLAGNGRAIYLVGDAGLGKSRLAQAALDAAVRDGAVTLTIHCTPSTTNTPLFPISVLLRSMVSATPSCSDAEKHADPQRLLRRLLPDPDVEKCLALLSPLFGIEAAAPQADTNPAELRDRTIATLARVMTGFSNGAPLVIVCEDLHWADHTTAQVLSRLPKEIGCRRALLIVTARLRKPASRHQGVHNNHAGAAQSFGINGARLVAREGHGTGRRGRAPDRRPVRRCAAGSRGANAQHLGSGEPAGPSHDRAGGTRRTCAVAACCPVPPGTLAEFRTHCAIRIGYRPRVLIAVARDNTSGRKAGYH